MVIARRCILVITALCCALPMQSGAQKRDFRGLARDIASDTDIYRRTGSADFVAPIPGSAALDAPTAHAQTILDRTRALVHREFTARSGQGPGVSDRARYVIFASVGLSPGVLSALIDESVVRGDAEVVFRGIPDGWSIETFASNLISTESDIALPIAIDPVAFRNFGVDVVPAIADRQSGKVVFGGFDPERLHGAEPGTHIGATVEIAEPDLIKVMQRRFAALDLKAKRDAALDRFWQRQTFVELPKATRDSVRPLDMSTRLQRDVVLDDGTLIARRGERIDPRASAGPLDLTLIVFDGTDEAEIAHVSTLLADIAQAVLITSKVPRTGGFESLRDLSQRLRESVFLLDAAFARRWQIRATPSVISDDGTGIVLHEHQVTR